MYMKYDTQFMEQLYRNDVYYNTLNIPIHFIAMSSNFEHKV